MSDAKHVFAGILDVMQSLSKDGIAKERENEQQRYNFRGIDDVYNALSSKLCAARIAVFPSYSGHVVAQRGETKAGAKVYAATVIGDFRIVSAVDGSEVTVTFPGEATDNADKATNKAMSAAFKYMCMQTFCIPTEGDNDADARTIEVARAPAVVEMTAEDLGKVQDCLARISKAKTTGELDKLAQELEKESAEVRKACRKAYKEQMIALGDK